MLGSLASSGAGHRFYEIYEPAGPPRGTMLVIHGGAWKDQRGDARRMMAAASATFRKTGWRVVDIGYSPGRRPPGRGIDPRPMLRDVVAFYDQVHRAFGGPVCAYGESAGGHLAAMLAVERPRLTCAILAAAPVDLPTVLRDTIALVKSEIRRTFGERRSMLDTWSPAQLWDTGTIGTAVFATAASNDTTVPPNQLRAFAGADPSADTRVVPGARAGAAGAVPWMHSVVRQDAITARLFSLAAWLDTVVPRTSRSEASQAGSGGADCARPTEARWKLLLAGDAWQQAATPEQPIAATRGCSGSARWQDDGLSLWALPARGAVLATGAQASLTLQSDHVVRRLSAEFRGFLARPEDWTVGLYASARTHGVVATKVAACDRGSCSGLRLVGTKAGSLIAAEGSRGDPDRRDRPRSADFALPPGTRRVAWKLRCIAPGGCSLTGITNLLRISPRPRDPLGHPAIFSLYRVQVR